MKKNLIWDLPTRLFHWAFAGFLTASILLSLVVDDDSPLFQWHMLCGLAAASLLVVRVVMGIVGSRHVRFLNFPIHPSELARYAAGVLSGQAKRYAGHNPGAAVAALSMFTLVAGLAVTGAGVGGESLEDLHGPLAYTLMAIIGLHLAGLAVYTLRHRENIAASMLTGRKEGLPEDALTSAHPAWGLAFLLAGGAWVGALLANHDTRAATVRLPVLGAVVTLGEQGSHDEGRDRRKRDHDDD